MNRRSFFASALAAPIAAVMGWKWKPFRTRKVSYHQIGMVGYKGWENDILGTGKPLNPEQWAKLVGSIKYNSMTKEMSMLAEDVWKANAEIKASLASTVFEDSFWS